jgi:hypothetical protein
MNFLDVRRREKAVKKCSKMQSKIVSGAVSQTSLDSPDDQIPALHNRCGIEALQPLSSDFGGLRANRETRS